MKRNLKCETQIQMRNENKQPGQNWASTAAPLYALLRIRNRVKKKDAHFVQATGNKLFSFFPFWIFVFLFFLFSFFIIIIFWIFFFFYFLDFLTFHHTRVFLPSSHKDVLIFQLYRRSAFLNFTTQKFFQIFTTQGF